MAATLLAVCTEGADEGIAATSTASSPATATAVWRSLTTEQIGPGTRSFTAQVSRLGCNNAVTGVVQAPVVLLSGTEVVITFSVDPPLAGDLTCPLNNEVPIEIALDASLGDRALVDDTCRADGEAKRTTFCRDGAERYVPAEPDQVGDGECSRPAIGLVAGR